MATEPAPTDVIADVIADVVRERARCEAREVVAMLDFRDRELERWTTRPEPAVSSPGDPGPARTPRAA